jgi:hypothetical protein
MVVIAVKYKVIRNNMKSIFLWNNALIKFKNDALMSFLINNRKNNTNIQMRVAISLLLKILSKTPLI